MAARTKTKTTTEAAASLVAAKAAATAGLDKKAEDVVEVTDSADKELTIQFKLEEMDVKWSAARFNFAPWKARGVNILVRRGLRAPARTWRAALTPHSPLHHRRASASSSRSSRRRR